MLVFEWDDNKAKINIVSHGISFDEASTAFADTLSLTIYDPQHSRQEDRYILLGNSVKNRLLVIVHTYRNEKIRIISARKATPNERIDYEKYTKSI
jgi:uncharacterized protein